MEELLPEDDIPSADEKPEEQAEQISPGGAAPAKKCGAYWYLPQSEDILTKRTFLRLLITLLAIIVEFVVLIIPQGNPVYNADGTLDITQSTGTAFVTGKYPSYSYVYTWAVFIMFAASVYVAVMNLKFNKLEKRIPVTRARRGFKFFTFPATEIFVIVTFIVFAIELSFVCISFAPGALVAMLLTFLACGGAVASRQIAHVTLKQAEYIDEA